MSSKKIYFASDVHLGLCTEKQSRDRDRLFSQWLSDIASDAKAIYILGDLFDFWFEYKKVVPKGFTRVLGKLAELADSGIDIHIFPGNHDLWMFGYFEEELGVKVHHHQPCEVELYGKVFIMGHGDGVGPGDKGYKRLQRIFKSRFLQRMFSALHPRIGVGLAQLWSKHSRLSKGVAVPFRSEEEPLYKYAHETVKHRPASYFVFGHRHTPLIMNVGESSQLVILGEWIRGAEYGVFDGEKFELKKYEAR